MTKQPEALLLADSLKNCTSIVGASRMENELRRLHEVNQELLEALKFIRNSGYMPQALIEHIDAIAKGEQP
jgi:hypothetical protein